MIPAIVHTIHKYSVLNICQELTTTFYYGIDLNENIGLLNMNNQLVCNWRTPEFPYRRISNLFTGYPLLPTIYLPKKYW